MLRHTLPDTPGKLAALTRSAQLTDSRWIPLRDVPVYTAKTGKTCLPAGTPVEGLPYSSTEPTDKFICENISLDTFFSAIADPDCAIYTKDLGGHRNSWAYFGIVCNGLVRYALNIRRRFSTKRWLDIPGMHRIAMPEAYRLEDMRLCDVLYSFRNGGGHVALITDLLRDEDGVIRMVEVSEAVRPSCRRACFTPEEFYEKYKTFGLCRYDGVDSVPMPEPIHFPQTAPLIHVDYGNRSNYFSGEPVVLTVTAPGMQEVRLCREAGAEEMLRVTGNVSLTLEPDWYTAIHTTSGQSVSFCVCRPEIQYAVRDGMLTVRAKSTDPKSRVLFLDLREISRAQLEQEQLPEQERKILQSPLSAPLAQILELTEEERLSGEFTRPVHPDARNFKVCFENPNGIWTHTMLPLFPAGNAR